MNTRLQKVNSLLKKEVGRLIREEVELPDDILVTVTNATTSVDLKYATVFVSVLPHNKAPSTMLRLNKRVPLLQRHINKKLVMRNVPRINLKLDLGEQHAADIEKLLSSEKRYGPRNTN